MCLGFGVRELFWYEQELFHWSSGRAPVWDREASGKQKDRAANGGLRRCLLAEQGAQLVMQGLAGAGRELEVTEA